MNYTFKIVGKEIVPEFTLVFNRNKQKKIDPVYFSKKFSSPTDLEYVGSVAYDDSGKLVSHICTIPIKLNYNGNIYNAGFAADNLTDINHRRKGLFRATTEFMINHLKNEEDIKVLFSLPNPPNYIGFVKHLGYSHVDDFHSFDLPTKCIFPFVKLFNKFKLFKLRHWYFKCMIFLLSVKNNEHMSNSLTDKGHAAFIHDKGFFNYKKYDDKYLIKIRENTIWFKIEDGMVVGDFNYQDEKDFILALKKFCKYTGIHKVLFRVCSGTEQYCFLNEFLDVISKSPICMINISNENIDLSQIKLVFADSNTF